MKGSKTVCESLSAITTMLIHSIATVSGTCISIAHVGNELL